MAKTDNVGALETAVVHKRLVIFYLVIIVLGILLRATSTGPTEDISLGFVIYVFSMPGVHLIAYIGASRGHVWAQGLSYVIATLLLLWIPIGTVIGIYLFKCLGRWEEGLTPSSN